MAPSRYRHGRRLGLRLLAISAVVTTGACSLFENDEPDQVRVQVEGNTQQQVRIIVSREFLVFQVGEGPDQSVQVEIVSADTVIAAPPFDRNFPLAPYLPVPGPRRGYGRG